MINDRQQRAQFSEASNLDQLPPNDQDAERGLLGCVLLNFKVVMPEIRATISDEAFFDLRHRAIWQTACELFDGNKPGDEVAMLSALRNSGRLEQIGGLGYFSELPNTTPSAYNWPTYLEDLQRVLILRRIIGHGADSVRRANEAPRDVESLLASVESEWLSIRQSATPRADFVDFKAMRRKTIEEYESALSESGRKGLVTGYPDLDRIVGGLRAQELVILAGTPSSGKTSLALNVAVNAALNQGIKTGIVSLETSGFKLVHRLNCIASGASGSRLLNGRPIQSDMDKLAAAAPTLKKIGEHVLIYDRGALNAPQVVSMMRRLYAKGCRLFILDYLQLLDASQKTSNGNERMTLVSRAMKSAAKELDCPVIGISSLNRQSAKEGRPPSRSDLRESGSIEFDADVIILLHPNSQDSETRTIQVNVDKNKDGETGKIELTFFPFCMQFKSVCNQIEPEDHPRYPHHD